jgi:hypothetical protein
MTERPTEQLQPKARPQVGAGVSDLERGIRCHQEILGLMRLKGPSGVRVDQRFRGEEARDALWGATPDEDPAHRAGRI